MENNERCISEFSRIVAGMTPSQVADVLGEPDQKNESLIPDGSGVGTQSGMWIKILPGEPYLEWVYHTESINFTIWFAKVEDSWKTAVKLPIPVLA